MTDDFVIGVYVGILFTTICWAIHLAFLATKRRK